MRVDRNEIVAGDHIYTWRSGYIYAHHGVYIGENMVVHFTSKIAWSSFDFSASCSKNLPDCRFHKPESGVKLSCLDCFLFGGSLYRYEYGISVTVFMVKVRSGTCTTAKSDAPEVVISRTMRLLNYDGFGDYDVVKNNCEDFAIYCKTGLRNQNQSAHGRSGQVAGARGTTIMVAAGIVAYCWNRYASDPGVRRDFVKEEEEDQKNPPRMFNARNSS